LVDQLEGEKKMNKTVEKGKTLLIDGPASVHFVSGYAEVLGAPLKTGERIVVIVWKAFRRFLRIS
jgi:hypothetical protein